MNQLSREIAFHEELWFISFSCIVLHPDHHPCKQRQLLCFASVRIELWQKLWLEYLFSWSLSWHLLSLCWYCLRYVLALIFSQERRSIAFQTPGLSQRGMIESWELKMYYLIFFIVELNDSDVQQNQWSVFESNLLAKGSPLRWEELSWHSRKVLVSSLPVFGDIWKPEERFRIFLHAWQHAAGVLGNLQLEKTRPEVTKSRSRNLAGRHLHVAKHF